VEAGADAVGLICGITHVSEDALTPDQARDLARRTPPMVSTVLVTHLESAVEILELAGYVGADTIQVHGLVTTETLASIFERAHGRRVTKAVHVVGSEAVERAVEIAGFCDAVLLDSRTNDRLGGTGRTHEWSVSRQVVGALRDRGRPVILAAG
jgi:phosphoribosylanthranilate isomerase